MKKVEFAAALAKWQSVLGLNNWKVYFKMTTNEEIWGACNADPKNLTAEIKVAKGADETVPLHEMLHVLLAELMWEVETFCDPDVIKRVQFHEERLVIALTRIISKLDNDRNQDNPPDGDLKDTET